MFLLRSFLPWCLEDENNNPELKYFPQCFSHSFFQDCQTPESAGHCAKYWEPEDEKGSPPIRLLTVSGEDTFGNESGDREVGGRIG